MMHFEKVADEINKMRPGSVHYIVANIGVWFQVHFAAASSSTQSLFKSKAGCDGLINEFKKRENKLHILVNNSGITWGAPFTNFPEKEWDNVFAVNVKSIFYSKFEVVFNEALRLIYNLID